MTDSQRIVFDMAMQILAKGIARHSIVSSANFMHNRDNEGRPTGKYVDWAVESDAMEKELKEGYRLLQIIKKENQ